jgi:hypothetical protein
MMLAVLINVLARRNDLKDEGLTEAWSQGFKDAQQPNAFSSARWPEVAEDDWCGEWASSP